MMSLTGCTRPGVLVGVAVREEQQPSVAVNVHERILTAKR